MKTSTIPMVALNSTEYDAIKSGLIATLDGKRVYLCLDQAEKIIPKAAIQVLFSCQKCGRPAQSKRANGIHERFSHGIKGKAYVKKGKK